MSRTIVISGTFVTLNQYIDAERSNFRVAARIKKEATETVQWSMVGVSPIEKYPVKLSFCWYCKNTKTDPDNIAFAKKYILDGLVKSGVLKSDAWKFTSGGFEDAFFVDENNPRVEIEIIYVGNHV